MSRCRNSTTFKILVVAAFTHGCVPKTAQKKTTPHHREAPAFSTLRNGSLDRFTVDGNLALGTDAEAILAVGQSGLRRSQAAKIAATTVTELGVLPEILTPSVRAEIQSNDMLGILKNLPDILGGSLLEQFASDAALGGKVRSGLSEKLSAGLAPMGGSTLGTRMPFHFDHFVRPSKSVLAITSHLQAAHWNLAWSDDGLWTGGRPLDGIDHGLQLLTVLRTLSEWTYVFGISAKGEPSPFGGLLKKWNQGALTPSKPLPITDPSMPEMIFTGDITISVPANKSALDLATQGGEQWTSTATTLPLIEQAAVWIAGAKAFGRMRADRRTKAGSLFNSSTPVLSAAAAKLPLLFLINMGKMLDGPFINAKTQKIFMAGCASDACPTADARSTVRLVEALSEWILATDQINGAGLDAETAGKITAATPKLKTALQLAMRTLSGDLTVDVTSASEHWLNVLITPTDGIDPASVSAEVIGTMASVERNVLNSPLLQLRITALANGHAKKFYGSENSLKSMGSILWNGRMVRELELSKIGGSLPWLPSVKQTFKEALGRDWVDQ